MPKRLRNPTPAEIELLKVLWSRGTATVRDLVDDLNDGRAISTVATTLRRMHAKGLVRLVDERKPQRFESVRSQDETFAAMASGLDRKFGRSLAQVVREFLGGSRATRKEIDEAKRLLDEYGGGT